jgi:hypothetical protein
MSCGRRRIQHFGLNPPKFFMPTERRKTSPLPNAVRKVKNIRQIYIYIYIHIVAWRLKAGLTESRPHITNPSARCSLYDPTVEYIRDLSDSSVQTQSQLAGVIRLKQSRRIRTETRSEPKQEENLKSVIIARGYELLCVIIVGSATK